MKREIKKTVNLMLKSCDYNPYSGKLSKEDNIIAALDLSNLCLKFAEEGQISEALNLDSEHWKQVIIELERMKIIEINSYNDLPEYGKYVLVSGIDNKTYGKREWHVCEINDLEDGLDFKNKGEFYWLTENGTKIDNVTHYCELPQLK